MKLIVVLQPEEDGGYSVTCPAVPGAVSQGDTLSEALLNITEAVEELLDICSETGDGHPQETAEIVASEIREVLLGRAEDELPLLIETRQVEVRVPLPARAETTAG